MRIHIQDCRTRKFWRDIDVWVEAAPRARNFNTSMDAFRHCIDLGLAGVNIVVDLGSRREPMIIPVDKELAGGSRAPHAAVAWD